LGVIKWHIDNLNDWNTQILIVHDNFGVNCAADIYNTYPVNNRFIEHFNVHYGFSYDPPCYYMHICDFEILLDNSKLDSLLESATVRPIVFIINDLTRKSIEIIDWCIQSIGHFNTCSPIDSSHSKYYKCIKFIIICKPYEILNYELIRLFHATRLYQIHHNYNDIDCEAKLVCLYKQQNMSGIQSLIKIYLIQMLRYDPTIKKCRQYIIDSSYDYIIEAFKKYLNYSSTDIDLLSFLIEYKILTIAPNININMFNNKHNLNKPYIKYPDIINKNTDGPFIKVQSIYRLISLDYNLVFYVLHFNSENYTHSDGFLIESFVYNKLFKYNQNIKISYYHIFNSKPEIESDLVV